MKQDDAPIERDISLSLCLSGGGLRATYFHLGAVEALRRCTVDDRPMIDRVRDIYAVSGGSIIGEHLVRRWAEYRGTDAQFAKASGELRAFAARDLRGRVVRRWALSLFTVFPRIFGWGRTRWLASEYEFLYRNCCIADFYTKTDSTESKPPKLHVLSASFKTGECCTFTAEGFSIWKAASTPGKYDFLENRADLLKMSLAVAASSAFPPMFPPVRLTAEMLAESRQDFPIYLSDGGIYDNLGLEAFLMNSGSGRSDTNTVLLSNAGSSFKYDAKSSFSNIITRNIRATDIMMRRIAESTDEKASRIDGVSVIEARIGTVAGSTLRESTQKRLRKVRTDLDLFSPALVEMLVQHGYDVTRKALSMKGYDCPERPQSDVLRRAPDSLDRAARMAEKRVLFRFVFRDWTIPVGLALVAALAFQSIHVWRTFYMEKGEIQASIIEKEDLYAANDQDRERIAALNEENFVLRGEIEIMRKKFAELYVAGFGTSKVDPAIFIRDARAFDRRNYKIWIQFAGRVKRDDMIDFAGRLNESWTNIPGASRGGERNSAAAGLNEVRYGPDADMFAAEQLAKDIFATGIVSELPKLQPVKMISGGSLEIWINP
jgi:predicted acylesterase/phospholipase RssA